MRSDHNMQHHKLQALCLWLWGEHFLSIWAQAITDRWMQGFVSGVPTLCARHREQNARCIFHGLNESSRLRGGDLCRKWGYSNSPGYNLGSRNKGCLSGTPGNSCRKEHMHILSSRGKTGRFYCTPVSMDAVSEVWNSNKYLQNIERAVLYPHSESFDECCEE